MINETDTVSDNILVTRIRQSDSDAFKLLFNRYSRKIYHFSLKYIKNTVEAEELVQSVFINIWENRESLDTSGSVKSYIYKAAVNHIYNYLRKRGIRTRFKESEVQKGEIHSNHTYEQVFLHDLERSISSFIDTLPSQQQKIFRMSRYEGLTHQEIANRLDLSVRTVENQIYRVLKALRTILKEGYF